MTRPSLSRPKDSTMIEGKLKEESHTIEEVRLDYWFNYGLMVNLFNKEYTESIDV